MSGEQAVPSPERIAEIREQFGRMVAERTADDYGWTWSEMSDVLAALTAVTQERDTAREERDATSETRAELQRSYESEVAELRSALDEAGQRIAAVEAAAEPLRKALAGTTPEYRTYLVLRNAAATMYEALRGPAVPEPAETPKPGDPLPDLPVDQIPVGTVVEVIRDTDGLAFYKLTDGWAGGMLLWQWCPSNSVFTHDQMGGYRSRGARVVRWGEPSAVREAAPVATADEEETGE
jgi:hypothetical protein